MSRKEPSRERKAIDGCKDILRLLLRFLKFVKYDPRSGCYVWTGAKNKNGYGLFTIDYAQYGPHRLVYELLVDRIPPGLEVHHDCENHSCVTPAHLKTVTHAENLLLSDTKAAQNASKTHCKNGHPFTPENTVINPKGHRVCRTCKLARERSARKKKRMAQGKTLAPPNKAKTHCKNGHEYTPENTYVDKLGRRSCRECRRKACEKYRVIRKT